ncbi:MAG TPA: hypothetical protein VGJ22_02380 [Anaerolineales bacterium]|jgi:hypothetical protein
MMSKSVRLILAIVVLCVSLSLLAWGLWPTAHEARTVRIQPAELILPTPVQ